jgi:hypothetical protein
MDDHDFHLAVAAREPESGLAAHYHRLSAPAPSAITAVKQGSDWVLNGELTGVANAPGAKLFAVEAAAITFLLPRETAGLSIEDPPRARTGAQGASSVRWHHGSAGTVTLRNCTVPAANLLGGEGKGASAAREYSKRSAVVLAAANVGIVNKQQCIRYALSGPMIRGSGIPLDLRRDRPYSIYERLEFDVIVGSGMKGTLGDCWDRYWVKMQEMKQCCRILRQCIKQIPAGQFRAKLPRNMKVPPGEVYAEYENPRGHLGFFIESQGGAVPYRVKIRAPSLCVASWNTSR